MNRQLLHKQIEILKNNIQEDLQENQNDSFEFKLNELNQAMTSLKDITEKQKQQSKLEREYRKACRLTDSLKYHSIKNKPNANEILLNLKMTREKAQTEYMTNKILKENYNSFDSKKYPGFLFLHKPILNEYGLCPYIEIESSSEEKKDIDELIEHQDNDNLSNDDSDTNIHYQRHKWLLEQSDQGKLYFEWYDRIINEKNHTQLIEEQKELEIYIYSLFEKYLSKSQFELLNNTVKLLQEYMTTTIKNKKVKDQFKTIIFNVSKIVNESGIHVESFLNLKYTYIPINEDPDIKIDKIIEHFNKIIYKDTIHKYTSLSEDIKQESKYISKIKENLEDQLNHYLLKKQQERDIEKQHSEEVTQTFKQEGKYFKKWSDLTENERKCRFESYSQFYIYKHKLHLQRSDQEVQNLITSLSNIIFTDYSNKKLKYKDFKWNVKLGIIEKINGIQYTPNTNSNLTFNSSLTNDNLSNNINNNSSNNINDNLDDIIEFKIQYRDVSNNSQSTQSDQSSLSRKSIKSLLTKDSEKIINEHFVCCIVKFLDNSSNVTDELIEQHKETTIEFIKNKLKVKRITNSDKQLLINKYNNMYHIISNQKYTE